eukprot:Selendium_serpulae@DN11287_c0_g1_i1.p1
MAAPAVQAPPAAPSINNDMVPLAGATELDSVSRTYSNTRNVGRALTLSTKDDYNLTVIMKEGKDMDFVRPSIEFVWRSERYRTKQVKSKNPVFNETCYIKYNPAKDPGEIKFLMRGNEEDGFAVLDLTNLTFDRPVQHFLPLNNNRGQISIWAGIANAAADGGVVSSAIRAKHMARLGSSSDDCFSTMAFANLPTGNNGSAPDGVVVAKLVCARDLADPKAAVHPYVDFQWRDKPFRS